MGMPSLLSRSHPKRHLLSARRYPDPTPTGFLPLFLRAGHPGFTKVSHPFCKLGLNMLEFERYMRGQRQKGAQ